MINPHLTVNQNGHLMIGGCDTVELAKKFGTPLYVIDEQQVRENCRLFKDSIEKKGVGNLPIPSILFL